MENFTGEEVDNGTEMTFNGIEATGMADNGLEMSEVDYDTEMTFSGTETTNTADDGLEMSKVDKDTEMTFTGTETTNTADNGLEMSKVDYETEMTFSGTETTDTADDGLEMPKVDNDTEMTFSCTETTNTADDGLEMSKVDNDTEMTFTGTETTNTADDGLEMSKVDNDTETTFSGTETTNTADNGLEMSKVDDGLEMSKVDNDAEMTFSGTETTNTADNGLTNSKVDNDTEIIEVDKGLEMIKAADTTGKATLGSTEVFEDNIPMTKLRIFKNILVVSTGFLFLFTAFQSMANLQTSLNKEDGVGAYSLSAIYAGLIVSCIFLPKFVIARIGCKWTIPICMVGYALYMAANFYAVIWLMTIAGVILGIGAAPMWSAKCTYLTQLGIWYSKLTKQSEDVVINKFFGFFFMVFQTSQIWGNLISSNVLKEKPASNETNTTEEYVCGADFLPKTDTNNTGFTQPAELVRNLCIIYLLCAVVAMVIVSLLLDPIKLDKEASVEDRKLNFSLLVATVRHVLTSPVQILLIPLTVYSGVEQAFIGGDFTQSYVSCTLGVANVGYIFICYGVVDALCSFCFGRLVQFVGHIPFFMLALIVHGALQLILLFWEPDPDMPVYFYIIAGFWGMGDAVIQTQINALYGALFTDNTEAAFANYRLWESAGFVMTYIYQNNLRTRVKLYVCLGFLGTGMFMYAITESMERRKKSKCESSPTADGA